MIAIFAGISAWCRKRFGLAAVLALSIVAIQCGGNRPQLSTIDRSSFPPCPGVPPERPIADDARTADEGHTYIATGTRSGTYVLLGDAITRVANSAMGLAVCTTNGSDENLRLLRERKVQFALVQLDTLHYVLEGAGAKGLSTGDPDRPVRLVTPLYSEKVHLFLRPHLYLTSPAEIARAGTATGTTTEGGKSGVWLGPPQSGGRVTALKVLEAAGITDDPVSFEWARQNVTDWNIPANCLVAGGKVLNAYFRTMAVPHKAKAREGKRPQPLCPAEGSQAKAPELSVDDLLKAEVQLIQLPAPLIDRLTEDGLYVRTTITLRNYRNLPRGVSTVGIPTLLLTNLPDTDGSAVEQLINAIQDNKAAIEQDVLVTDRQNDNSVMRQQIDGVELDQFSQALTIDGVAPHPGAEKHLRPSGAKLLWLSLFVLGLLATGGWRNPQSFRRGLAAASYFWILSASLAGILILVSLEMMQAEGTLNRDFETFSNSLINTLQLVTRFNDYEMMTPEGKIWRWLGLFLFPVFLGWLLSDFVKELFRVSAIRLARTIKRGRAHDAYRALVDFAALPKRIVKPRPKGPLVFLNWNSRAEQMAQEFRRDAASADQQIVVVRAKGSQPIPANQLQNVRIVDGDPTARDTIEKAGIVNASAVAILSAWAPTDPDDRRRTLDPDIADTKTIRAILAIRALCEDRNRSRTLPITAEIRLTRNMQEARKAVDGERLTVTCLI